MSENILIVDDDLEIRTLVADYLKMQSFNLYEAENGIVMERVLAQHAIDLIVLDLNLPGQDGLTLCRNLRANSNTPVLMLSARSDMIDRVLGLEMGADDYLTKPFEPRELLARIRNILRRIQAPPDGKDVISVRNYQFSGRVLDMLVRHLLLEDGTLVVLANSEFRLLKLFLERPQRVLSRDWLAQTLLNREIDALDRTIDLQVSKLRQKIGDDARKPELIKTIRSEGYMLMTPVEKNVATTKTSI